MFALKRCAWAGLTGLLLAAAATKSQAADVPLEPKVSFDLCGVSIQEAVEFLRTATRFDIQIGGWAVNELQVFTPDPDACAAHSEEIPTAYGFGHMQVYRDIVAALRGGPPYPVDRADCASTLKLLHAFYRSDEAGDWVEVASAGQSRRLGRDDDAISALYRTPAP